MTSPVHPMVSVDCNSSVYEVFSRLAVFGPLEIIMRLQTWPHIENDKQQRAELMDTLPQNPLPIYAQTPALHQFYQYEMNTDLDIFNGIFR